MSYMCRFCGMSEERDRFDPCTKCGGWRMLEDKWVNHRENTPPKNLMLNVQDCHDSSNYVAQGVVKIWAGDCPILCAKKFCYNHHLDDDLYVNSIVKAVQPQIAALEQALP